MTVIDNFGVFDGLLIGFLLGLGVGIGLVKGVKCRGCDWAQRARQNGAA